MRSSRVLLVSAALVCALAVTAVACAQDGRTIVLRKSGLLLLKDAEGEFATLELNLHNSDWTYSSQVDAAAKCDSDGAERRFTGAIPVPEVAGAAVSFLETISPFEGGVRVIHELRPSGPMILNGLQISLLLPTDRFGGSRLIIGSDEGPDRSIILPRTLDPDRWQLGTIKGNSIRIGGDEETAVTLKIDKSYDLVLHDLRQWERDEFEVRIPIIAAAAEGQTVGANDRWDIELTISPGPIEITGP